MILAVDDDLDILAALRRALAALPQTLGHSAALTTVADPYAALELLANQRFDVLISDVDMPGMNGHELMREVRARRPDVVRILLTGRATLESAMRAINEGEVHRFLAKPFEAAELRSVVQGAIDRRAVLARASDAALRAERQRGLVERMDAEFPGLSRVVRDDDGTYVVSAARAAAGARAVRRLGLTLRRPAS